MLSNDLLMQYNLMNTVMATSGAVDESERRNLGEQFTQRCSPRTVKETAHSLSLIDAVFLSAY